MVEIQQAQIEDLEVLTEIQIRTFIDDNQHKPPGCSLEILPSGWEGDWLQILKMDTSLAMMKQVNSGAGIMSPVGNLIFDFY